MADPDRAFRIVQALRESGVSISIDDFGTGYSSLAYLQNLNIDRLKIDRSFVAGMNVSDGSRVIVASIIQLGHALGLKIVAEGIETDAQCQRLSALGCDFGQGFFFAPALSGEALLEWCARQPGFAITAEFSNSPRSALARG
jgi:sensor c-di-GMP phosphodiesterase-like protein